MVFLCSMYQNDYGFSRLLHCEINLRSFPPLLSRLWLTVLHVVSLIRQIKAAGQPWAVVWPANIQRVELAPDLQSISFHSQHSFLFLGGKKRGFVTHQPNAQIQWEAPYSKDPSSQYMVYRWNESGWCVSDQWCNRWGKFSFSVYFYWLGDDDIIRLSHCEMYASWKASCTIAPVPLSKQQAVEPIHNKLVITNLLKQKRTHEEERWR